MLRKLLLLCACIWGAMYLAPELDEPVFREVVTEAEPVAAPPEPAEPVAIAETPAPEPVTAPVALVSPASVAEPQPAEPEVVAAPPQPAEEAVPQEQPVIRYVAASRVNVRGGPSTDYAVLSQVVLGDAAEVISDPSEPWVRIRIEGDGVEGWIAARFLTEAEPNY